MSRKSRENAEKQRYNRERAKFHLAIEVADDKMVARYPHLRVRRELGQAWLSLKGAQNDVERAVAACRSQGLSWTEVGEILGISRQGARQRFGGKEA